MRKEVRICVNFSPTPPPLLSVSKAYEVIELPFCYQIWACIFLSSSQFLNCIVNLRTFIFSIVPVWCTIHPLTCRYTYDLNWVSRMACIFGWRHEHHIIGRREGRIQVNEWCLMVSFTRKIDSFKWICKIDVPQLIHFLGCLESVSTSRWEINVMAHSQFHMICSNVGCFKIKMFHECFIFFSNIHSSLCAINLSLFCVLIVWRPTNKN